MPVAVKLLKYSTSMHQAATPRKVAHVAQVEEFTSGPSSATLTVGNPMLKGPSQSAAAATVLTIGAGDGDVVGAAVVGAPLAGATVNARNCAAYRTSFRAAVIWRHETAPDPACRMSHPWWIPPPCR